MTTPYLHAAWFASVEAATEYLKVARSLDGVREAAGFRADSSGAEMSKAVPNLQRLDIPRLRERPAQAWVLAELTSLGVGVELAERFGPLGEPGDAEFSGELLHVALLHQISEVAGPVAGDGHFADAHQFGVLGVDSPTAEWEVHRWYEQHRLVEVADMPGMIRTRRFAVVAGTAKYGVLYEFPSIEARREGFWAMSESRAAQDQTHPNAPLVGYTVHAPGAPFVGTKFA